MTTRQELYDRIRTSSKDEVILDDMIRLGFWPSEKEMPKGPAEEIRRQGELQRELRKLTSENRQLNDAEAIKRKLRKQRMAESKRKRQENKERRLHERAQRAEAWKKKKQTEILYVGKRHSGGLSNHESNLEKLSHLHLEHLGSVLQLAQAMSLSIGRLRYLAFGRKTSPTSHYRQFNLKKKSGGFRTISAPMPRLKRAQRWILDNILQKVELNDAAHGFRPDRSIVTNAEPHVGSTVVINMDLQDFFPTVNFPRIKGLFRSMGFSESVAIVLAMICSESELTEVELDQQNYFVARGERFLPQGAPTSPAITNMICRGMDARLTKVAQQLGFTYTRYADDITFSSRNSDADVGRAIRRIRHTVTDEGFLVHPNKTRVLRQGRRQEVTGLTVNQQVSVSRKELRRFRAVLFQIEKDGPAGKQWGTTPNVIAAIDGYANFVAMVQPEKGRALQQQVRRIIEKYGTLYFEYPQRERWKEPEPIHEIEQVQNATTAPVKPVKESQEQKPWWKFW